MAYADNGTEGLAYLVENHPYAMVIICMMPMVIVLILFWYYYYKTGVH